jgi:hypothetical protein
METFSRGTSSLDPWFVTGLINGLGTFTYSRSGRQLALYFGLKVPQQDADLLGDVRDFFGGIGRLYAVASADARPAASGIYFRVTRRDELPTLLDHFDRYPLRGAKAAALEIWREMGELKQEFRKPDRARLNDLAGQLTSINARRQS